MNRLLGVTVASLTFLGLAVLPAEFASNTQRSEYVANLAIEAEDLIYDAAASIDELRDKPRFEENLGQAKGVVIFPQFRKVGLLIGAEGGDGVLVMRKPDPSSWSAPLFFRLAGGSVGLQFGLEISQIGILLMTDQSLQAILDDGAIILGVGMDVTAGRFAGAIDVATHTDAYTYSLAEGVFAGVSFEGSNLGEDEARNAAYYGREIKASMIADLPADNSKAAFTLYEALNR